MTLSPTPVERSERESAEITAPRLDASPAPDPLASACELGEAIRAAANEIEAQATIPESLMTKLHAARMMRMLLPRSFDGDEVSPMCYLATLVELARHDASVAWNVFVANSSALIAPYLEPDVAALIFSDPRSLVSWGPPNECRAHAVEGGYRVSGQWPFASGCRQATWMGAHCAVVRADGSMLERDGRTIIRTLLFEVDKAERLYDWNPLGLRGTGSDSYRLDDVFVPERFSSTREDPFACREPGALYRIKMQELYAVGVAGVALGIARAMQDAYADLAQRKTPRGRGRLADSAATQAGVARCEAKTASARAWLEQVLTDIYTERPDATTSAERAAASNDADGAVARPISIPQRARIRLACIHCITQSVEVADWIHKAAGVSAIFPGSPFERRFRDIHTLSQQIQSRDAHFESVGQVMLGVPPPAFY